MRAKKELPALPEDYCAASLALFGDMPPPPPLTTEERAPPDLMVAPVTLLSGVNVPRLVVEMAAIMDYWTWEACPIGGANERCLTGRSSMAKEYLPLQAEGRYRIRVRQCVRPGRGTGEGRECSDAAEHTLFQPANTLASLKPLIRVMGWKKDLRKVTGAYVKASHPFLKWLEGDDLKDSPNLARMRSLVARTVNWGADHLVRVILSPDYGEQEVELDRSARALERDQGLGLKRRDICDIPEPEPELEPEPEPEGEGDGDEVERPVDIGLENFATHNQLVIKREDGDREYLVVITHDGILVRAEAFETSDGGRDEWPLQIFKNPRKDPTAEPTYIGEWDHVNAEAEVGDPARREIRISKLVITETGGAFYVKVHREGESHPWKAVRAAVQKTGDLASYPAGSRPDPSGGGAAQAQGQEGSDVPFYKNPVKMTTSVFLGMGVLLAIIGVWHAGGTAVKQFWFDGKLKRKLMSLEVKGQLPTQKALLDEGIDYRYMSPKGQQLFANLPAGDNVIRRTLPSPTTDLVDVKQAKTWIGSEMTFSKGYASKYWQGAKWMLGGAALIAFYFMMNEYMAAALAQGTSPLELFIDKNEDFKRAVDHFRAQLYEHLAYW